MKTDFKYYNFLKELQQKLLEEKFEFIEEDEYCYRYYLDDIYTDLTVELGRTSVTVWDHGIDKFTSKNYCKLKNKNGEVTTKTVFDWIWDHLPN